MDLEEVLKARRSIRKFEDRDVPTELILEAISSASWAPSGGNFQPWKFYVIKNRSLIDRIADAVQQKVDLMAGWPEAAEFGETFARYQRNACFFRSAPVLIAVAVGGYQSPADRVLRRRGKEDPVAAEMLRNREEISSRTQTVAGITAYLLLTLRNLGLGSCWMAGPMLARREIERLLEMPPELGLFSLVPVGYHGENPAAGPRKSLEEVVHILD